MSVQIKPGIWRRRDGLLVTVWPYKEGSGWMGSDGHHRWDDGLYARGVESGLDLVEYIGEPEPQPDAAEQLAGLRDDRDRWQARAVQAEGQARNLAQELVRVRAEARQANDARAQIEAILATTRQQLQDRDAADQVPGNEQLRQQITELIAERERLQTQSQADAVEIGELRDEVDTLEQQLRHSEQQRAILLETSQDQLGQIRMAERIVSLMADKIAQLAVERA